MLQTVKRKKKRKRARRYWKGMCRKQMKALPEELAALHVMTSEESLAPAFDRLRIKD